MTVKNPDRHLSGFFFTIFIQNQYHGKQTDQYFQIYHLFTPAFNHAYA